MRFVLVVVLNVSVLVHGGSIAQAQAAEQLQAQATEGQRTGLYVIDASMLAAGLWIAGLGVSQFIERGCVEHGGGGECLAHHSVTDLNRGLGALGLAVGGTATAVSIFIFYMTAMLRTPPPTSAISVVPMVSPTSAGVLVGGAF